MRASTILVAWMAILCLSLPVCGQTSGGASPATKPALKPYARKAKTGAPRWVINAVEQHIARRERSLVLALNLQKSNASHLEGAKRTKDFTEDQKKKMIADYQKTAESTAERIAHLIDPNSAPRTLGGELMPSADNGAFGGCYIEVVEPLGDDKALCIVYVGARRSGPIAYLNGPITPANAPKVKGIVSVEALDGRKKINATLVRDGQADHKGESLPVFVLPNIEQWLEPVK